MNEPSLFTKIIQHELPANIQYEDDLFIAFNDIHPQAPVHVLLVTKEQYPTLEDVDLNNDELHAKLLQTARKVAKKLGIEQNYKIQMNVGLAVQQVHHIHVHILGGWQKPEEEK